MPTEHGVLAVELPEMRYIIVDLEASCWEGVRSPDMETIETGAVALVEADGPLEAEFGAFIRPRLSEFCQQLTLPAPGQSRRQARATASSPLSMPHQPWSIRIVRAERPFARNSPGGTPRVGSSLGSKVKSGA